MPPSKAGGTNKSVKKSGSGCGTYILVLLVIAVVALTPLLLGNSAVPSFLLAPEEKIYENEEQIKSLAARLDKLSESQSLIDSLLTDLQDAQAKAATSSVSATTATVVASAHSPSIQSNPPTPPPPPHLAASAAVTQATPLALLKDSTSSSVVGPGVGAKRRGGGKAAPAKVWKTAAGAPDLFASVRPAAASMGATTTVPGDRDRLPCSANASIAVNRASAEAIPGVHWYDRSGEPRCRRTAVSHKMEPGCDGMGNAGKRAKQRQILVVGVQRSGTHYTWEMFNRLGVHVHHEGLGPDGAVSWLFAYNSLGGYAINNPEPLASHKFCFVFQQVRHPMRVISSIVKASRKPWDPYWDWITKVEPKVCGPASSCKKEPLLLRSARQWLVWNEHMELYADARFQVEHVSPRQVCRLAQFPDKICDSDGRFHTTSSKVIQAVVEPQAPADGHTGVSHLSASWEAIAELDPGLAERMKEMTKRYGYHEDAAMHPQSLSTEAFRAGGVDKVRGGKRGVLSFGNSPSFEKEEGVGLHSLTAG